MIGGRQVAVDAEVAHGRLGVRVAEVDDEVTPPCGLAEGLELLDEELSARGKDRSRKIGIRARLRARRFSRSLKRS